MKPKATIYWAASCGGCDEAVVDLGEDLLTITESIDVVLWPIALDSKYDDVRKLEDGEIAVSFINGAVRTSEQEEIVKLLRAKSKLVVAFGSCACMGGIPALANLTSRAEIMRRSYRDNPTTDNPGDIEPVTSASPDGYELELPEFYGTVYKLGDAIDVDYYLPGCPPSAEIVKAAIGAILEGKLPEKGAVLAPDVSLCGSCERNDSKPEDVAIDRIRRVTEIELDGEKCFLAQGVICMGPATRDGCGVPCINGNMPCTGCFGPTDAVRDQGGKMISALCGIIEADSEDSAARAFEGIPDPAGTFYRYGMSASLIGAKRPNNAPAEDV